MIFESVKSYSIVIKDKINCKNRMSNIRATTQFSPIGVVALIIFLIILLIALLSDLLSVYPYNIPTGSSLEAPNKNHWLGTDDLGIDLWAQICHGARVSIVVGLITAILSGFGGSIIGMFSGYFGGWIDSGIMRLTDLVITLPQLPTMIILGAFFGPKMRNIILVLVIFSWVDPARTIRSKILSLKEEKYIIAAKSFGANFGYIARKHFIPNILPLIMVNIVRSISRAIVAEAGLAFLGLGDPTSKSWGLILNSAMGFKGIYFTDYWKWWVVTPLLSIILLVVASALISRELELLVNSKN